MRTRARAGVAGALLGILALTVQPSAAHAGPPAFERTEDIRRAAIGDALATATRLQAALGHALKAIAGQSSALRTAYFEVAVRHPDRLAWTVTYGDGTTCGGMFNGVALTFENAAVPAPFDGTVDTLLGLLAESPDCGLPIAGLLDSQVLTTAAGVVLDEIRLGADASRGVDFREIGMRRADIDWQFHFAAGAKAPALRYLATFTRDPASPAYVVTFQSWQPDGEPGAPAAVSGLARPQSRF